MTAANEGNELNSGLQRELSRIKSETAELEKKNDEYIKQVGVLNSEITTLSTTNTSLVANLED